MARSPQPRSRSHRPLTTNGVIVEEPREPRVEKGSARSIAFVFDDRLHVRDDRERHCAITIHADGSGSIAIYDSIRCRQLASISLNSYEHFRAIRDAIDSQAQSADIARLRLIEPCARCGVVRREHDSEIPHPFEAA